MSAAPIPHLVIPFASSRSPAWLETMKNMPADGLKNLGRLLQGMKSVDADRGDALSLTPPHERVLARAYGLVGNQQFADGLIPWAAWQAKADLGEAWAIITPCHWAMGREHATLSDPAALKLSPEESQTLLAAMRPYFVTEGITLRYAAPDCWLAEGDLFEYLPVASLDRVLGRNVDNWLPGTRQSEEVSLGPAQAKLMALNSSGVYDLRHHGARTLRRLQNEMQMLLYNHPLNDERVARRQLAVNSFWVSGTGALDHALPRSSSQQISTPRQLAQAVFADDWQAYTQAWIDLDKGEIAELLARQRSGQTVRITLCGERSALGFETAPRGLLSHFSGFFKPESPVILLEQL